MLAFVVTKDPHARKQYEFDWREWLNGDTLLSVQFILSAGATISTDGSSFTAEGIVLVWVINGTDLTTDYLTCRITSLQGSVEDWTMQVNVREQ